MLVNARNNSDFAEAYIKGDVPKNGSAQLVLSKASHQILKNAVNTALEAAAQQETNQP